MIIAIARPRSRYGETCWISGITMLKAPTASRLRITSTMVKEIGSGIRNCNGATIAIGTMNRPIIRSASLGSRR